MQVIQARNAEHALRQGLELLHRYGQRGTSRNGPVIVAPWPVATDTERPTERVVLAAWRDANPFFHLVEAAWMLAGRDDVAQLTPYVKRFADYAEPDLMEGPGASTGVMHGAYGHRWRRAFGIDQLNVVVQRLRKDPDDRQCVIQMWSADVTAETSAGAGDLTGAWRDRPCNTHAYLRVRVAGDRPVADGPGVNYEETRVLDLTVCCRSNDMAWGAHGANAVHFSFLQEYLADRIGVGVGSMYQLSNNYHLYVSELAKMQARGDAMSQLLGQQHLWDLHADAYAGARPQPMRLPGEPPLDPDLERLWRYLEVMHTTGGATDPGRFDTAFCRLVWQAALAHSYYRGALLGGISESSLMELRRYSAEAAARIEADDWRAACRAWLMRRWGTGQ